MRQYLVAQVKAREEAESKAREEQLVWAKVFEEDRCKAEQESAAAKETRLKFALKDKRTREEQIEYRRKKREAEEKARAELEASLVCFCFWTRTLLDYRPPVPAVLSVWKLLHFCV